MNAELCLTVGDGLKFLAGYVVGSLAVAWFRGVWDARRERKRAYEAPMIPSTTHDEGG